MAKDKNNEKSVEFFNQYMLATLKRSSEHMHKIRQQRFNSIQLFITLITALTGGIVFILSSNVDENLKFTLLTVLLLFTSGFSTLTYLWLVSSIYSERCELAIRFLLEKYFRDLNPLIYKKYGLEDLYLPYSRFIKFKNLIVYKKPSTISLYCLGIFASLMSIGAGFIGEKVIPNLWLKPISIVLSVILFIFLIIIERRITRKVQKRYIACKNIFSKYHLPKNDIEITVQS